MKKVFYLIALIFFIMLINQLIKDIKNTPIDSPKQLYIIQLLKNK